MVHADSFVIVVPNRQTRHFFRVIAASKTRMRASHSLQLTDSPLSFLHSFIPSFHPLVHPSTVHGSMPVFIARLLSLAFRASASYCGIFKLCYDSVKMIRFSYSNEDTKDEERKLGCRQTTKCGAKRQARTLSQNHTASTLRYIDTKFVPE
jgi:hypothetical protein